MTELYLDEPFETGIVTHIDHEGVYDAIDRYFNARAASIKAILKLSNIVYFAANKVQSKVGGRVPDELYERDVPTLLQHHRGDSTKHCFDLMATFAFGVSPEFKQIYMDLYNTPIHSGWSNRQSASFLRAGSWIQAGETRVIDSLAIATLGEMSHTPTKREATVDFDNCVVDLLRVMNTGHPPHSTEEFQTKGIITIGAIQNAFLIDAYTALSVMGAVAFMTDAQLRWIPITETASAAPCNEHLNRLDSDVVLVAGESHGIHNPNGHTVVDQIVEKMQSHGRREADTSVQGGGTNEEFFNAPHTNEYFYAREGMPNQQHRVKVMELVEERASETFDLKRKLTASFSHPRVAKAIVTQLVSRGALSSSELVASFNNGGDEATITLTELVREGVLGEITLGGAVRYGISDQDTAEGIMEGCISKQSVVQPDSGTDGNVTGLLEDLGKLGEIIDRAGSYESYGEPGPIYSEDPLPTDAITFDKVDISYPKTLLENIDEIEAAYLSRYKQD